jgi:peptidoglycan/LPS O-acetylase OafA/YrhL
MQPWIDTGRGLEMVSRVGAREHIPELDGVRGLACTLVIILHVVVAPLPLMPGSWFDLVRFHIQPFMSAGVDLFFILSGFLISGALMDGKEKPFYFRRFWVRRAARIFPVYYLLIALAFIIRQVGSEYPTIETNSLVYASIPEWYYAIYIQNFKMVIGNNTGNNMLGVTWSLAIEEQFYLVFPFLVYFVSRKRLLGVAVAIIGLTPLIRGILVKEINWPAGYLLSLSRTDALMMGFIVACIVRSEKSLLVASKWQRHLNWAAAALIMAQLFGLWNYIAFAWLKAFGMSLYFLTLLCVQYPLINLAMAFLFLNIFTRKSGPLRFVFLSRPLKMIGLVSYGAYMYHQSINYVLWASIYGGDPAVTRVSQIYVPVLVLALTAAVSWSSLKYFEKPARRWITDAALPTMRPAAQH